MKNYPTIEVSFVVEGKNMILDQLTAELSIVPTETRTIDEWPKAIKNNKNLPEELQPRYIWCLTQKVELCKQIEFPVHKVLSKLMGKEDRLVRLCEENNFKTSINITIHAEAMNFPEITLSSEIVSYLGKLNAAINLDVYAY